MDLRLSWDLFILAFFGIVVAYSFIIGRNNVLKAILATYGSAFIADAGGNLAGAIINSSDNIMRLFKIFSIQTPEQAIMLAKFVIFAGVIVLFSIQRSINVEVNNGGSAGIRLVINMSLGFLNACLIGCIALGFISGDSFIPGSFGNLTPAFQDIYNQSSLARTLTDNYNIFFLLPGLAVIGMGILSGRKAEG